MTNKKEHDRSRLREAFYQAFDSGRFRHAGERLARDGRHSGFEPVGAGMHFRCFAETGALRGASMRTVVKVASREFLDDVGNVESWVAGLRRIKTADLVPPFEVLHQPATGGIQEVVALAMPFGPDPADRCASWWQPGDDLLKGFYQHLAQHSLHLGDIPQMRCWDGIPFIVDFSDLRPAGRG